MPELLQSTTTPRSQNARVRLVELADRQWGVVKRGQLEQMGLTPGAITRWVEEGRLHRIHPSVYAVGHHALGVEGTLAAALLYAGPGAGLWGETAAWWFRMLDMRPATLHVWAPRRRRSLSGVRIHTRRGLERYWHKGLPTTPPAQTLLDIADKVGFQQLRRAISEAEYLKLVTLEEVESVLGRGKLGSARLRAALDRHRPQLARTKSKLEEKFILFCERHSLPPPDVNVTVAGFEVDAVWFDRKVVVELDSHLAHGTPHRIENDHRRDLALRAAGYTVLRYTWGQITQEPEAVIGDLYSSALAT